MAKHFTLPYEGGLITENLPAGILHTYEKIWTHVYPESRPASYVIADYIVESINARKEGLYRLGVTTGATPVSLYNELARRYQAGKVSFRNVEIVSIDEYYPASADEARSRNRRLFEALLDKVDVLPENIHIPDGSVPPDPTRVTVDRPGGATLHELVEAIATQNRLLWSVQRRTVVFESDPD